MSLFSVTFPANTDTAVCSVTGFTSGSSKLSCSIWVKGVPATNEEVCGNADDHTGHGGWSMYSTTGGQAGKAFWNSWDGAVNEFQVVGNTTVLQDGNWHNCILTFDRSVGVQSYVDGTADSMTVLTGSVTNQNAATAVSFGLGALAAGDLSFTGKMAAFQIWDGIVLTSGNATSIAGGNTNVASPTATWLFTEGSGTVATDSVGSKTLTFTHVTWSSDIPSQLQPATGSPQRMMIGVGL